MQANVRLTFEIAQALTKAGVKYSPNQFCDAMKTLDKVLEYVDVKRDSVIDADLSAWHPATIQERKEAGDRQLAIFAAVSKLADKVQTETVRRDRWGLTERRTLSFITFKDRELEDDPS